MTTETQTNMRYINRFDKMERFLDQLETNVVDQDYIEFTSIVESYVGSVIEPDIQDFWEKVVTLLGLPVANQMAFELLQLEYDQMEV